MPVLASGKLYAVFSNSSNQMNLVVTILEIKSIFLVEVKVAFTFQLFPCFLLFLICILALYHDLYERSYSKDISLSLSLQAHKITFHIYLKLILLFSKKLPVLQMLFSYPEEILFFPSLRIYH